MQISEKQQTTTTKQGHHLNRYPICEFTPHISRDEEWSTTDFDATQPYAYTYGFETVQFWIPSKQSWEILDATRFRSNGASLEEAKQTFWLRYAIYTKKRFGYKVPANNISK